MRLIDSIQVDNLAWGCRKVRNRPKQPWIFNGPVSLDHAVLKVGAPRNLQKAQNDHPAHRTHGLPLTAPERGHNDIQSNPGHAYHDRPRRPIALLP